MADPNLELLRHVAINIGDLIDEVVFVGGCVVGLLVTDSAAAEVRETDDVDVVIEALGYGAYHKYVDRLRANGFREDTRTGAPICRFVHSGIALDFMPTDDSVIGFSNRWYPLAISTAEQYDVGIGRSINVISASCFVASKIVAFSNRGNSDFLGSHDLEDIVTVLDGRPEFFSEFLSASDELKSFVADRFREFLADPRFRDAIPGHIGNGATSKARVPKLLELFVRIAELP